MSKKILRTYGTLFCTGKIYLYQYPIPNGISFKHDYPIDIHLFVQHRAILPAGNSQEGNGEL